MTTAAEHTGRAGQDLASREEAVMLPTYRRAPVTFAAGAGCRLFDSDGAGYLDFVSGLAVTALGHAHPEVADAVAAQARRLVHTSNLYYTEPQVRLAERLQDTLGWPEAKVFLCNSGAEANEAAVKLTRRHGKTTHEDKVGVVALEGGFHGRTLATLALTGNPAKHTPFEPLGEWVTHVPRDDPTALEAAVDDSTCAVWVEVVQGEGGVHPVPDEVLTAARAACDRVGAVLVADEVQTGVGRLGSWYGWQGCPVTPDVVCLAKALANGLPVGAMVAQGPAAKAFGPGDHATTFGGGPVIAEAANTVLDVISRDELVPRAAELGADLEARLRRLVGTSELAEGLRGAGLLQALTLAEPVAGTVAAAALDRGLVVNAVAPDAIRLAPPLVATEAELDEAAALLAGAMEAPEVATARQI